MMCVTAYEGCNRDDKGLWGRATTTIAITENTEVDQWHYPLPPLNPLHLLDLSRLFFSIRRGATNKSVSC